MGRYIAADLRGAASVKHTTHLEQKIPFTRATTKLYVHNGELVVGRYTGARCIGSAGLMVNSWSRPRALYRPAPLYLYAPCPNPLSTIGGGQVYRRKHRICFPAEAMSESGYLTFGSWWAGVSSEGAADMRGAASRAPPRKGLRGMEVSSGETHCSFFTWLTTQMLYYY
jgi:hypothetical protein